MRAVSFLLVLAACETGKIQVIPGDSEETDLGRETDAGPDTDEPGGSGSDGGGETDDGAETDPQGDGSAPQRDDDGDCTCEIAPCTSSSNPACTDLGGDDCDDGNPAVSPA